MESVKIAEISAKGEIFLSYLERSFDERAENFRRLCDSLDELISNGGDISLILTSITALAAKSPFADLHDFDLVQERLADPTHEWEF